MRYDRYPVKISSGRALAAATLSGLLFVSACNNKQAPETPSSSHASTSNGSHSSLPSSRASSKETDKATPTHSPYEISSKINVHTNICSNTVINHAVNELYPTQTQDCFYADNTDSSGSQWYPEGERSNVTKQTLTITLLESAAKNDVIDGVNHFNMYPKANIGGYDCISAPSNIGSVAYYSVACHVGEAGSQQEVFIVAPHPSGDKDAVAQKLSTVMLDVLSAAKVS